MYLLCTCGTGSGAVYYSHVVHVLVIPGNVYYSRVVIPGNVYYSRVVIPGNVYYSRVVIPGNVVLGMWLLVLVMYYQYSSKLL